MSGYQPDSNQPQRNPYSDPAPFNPTPPNVGSPASGNPNGGSPGNFQQQYPNVPQKSGCGKLGCVIAVIAIIGTCIFACCGGLIYFSGSSNTGTPITESEQEKQDRQVAGFEHDPEIENHPDFLDVDSLLQQLQTVSDGGDASGLIDVDLLYREMIATGEMKPRYVARRIFMNSIVVQTEIVRPFEEFKIASITPIAGKTDEAIAHAYLSNDTATWRVELYVVRTGNNWKIFDWNEIGTNTRGSLELAVINGDDSSTRYREYNRFFQNAEKAIASQDADERERLLIQVNPDKAFPALRDSTWTALAGIWLDVNRADEALKCLDRLPNKNSPPDAVLYRGICEFENGNYRETIRLMDQYESLTGNSISAKEWKAETHQLLDDNEQALKDFEEILEIMPDHYYLDSFARLSGTDEQMESLVELIDRTKDPIETTEQLASSYYNVDSLEGLQRLQKYATEKDSESSTTVFIAGMIADLNNDFETATQLFQDARKNASESSKQTYDYHLMDIYLRHDKAVDFYRQSEDKVATLEELYWMWRDDEGIEASAMIEIAELHLKSHSNDRSAKEIKLASLLAAGKYDEVIAISNELAREDKTNPNPVFDSYSNFSYVATVTKAYVGTKKEFEALEKVEPFDQTFTRVSQQLRSSMEFDRLAKVMERFQGKLDLVKIKDAQKEDWESFYIAILLSKADILDHEKRFHEAAFLLLESRPEITTENQWRFGTIHFNCLSAINNAGDAANDWLVFENDKFRIKDPTSGRLSKNAIAWNDFRTGYNILKWDEDSSTLEKLLTTFQAFQETQPAFTSLHAELLNNANRSEEAAKLLDDAWLAKMKRASAAVDRQGTPEYVPIYNDGGDSLSASYVLLSRTARLNGDQTKAMKYAKILDKEFDSKSALIQGACVGGDVSLVKEMLESGDVSVWSISNEADAQAAFLSPKFDSVRREHPTWWSSDVADETSVFLFETNVPDAIASMRRFVDEELDSVEWLDATEPSDQLLFVQDSTLVRISIGSKPIKLIQQAFLPSAEREIVANHANWIAVELIENTLYPKHDSENAPKIRRKIDTEILKLKPSGLVRDWLALLNQTDIAAHISNDSKDISDFANSRNVYLDTDDSQDGSSQRGLSPSEIAKLNKAASKLSENELQKLKLDIAFDSLGKPGTCRVRVYDIERGNYGQLQFNIELDDNNPVAKFASGNQKYFQVGPGNIRKWSID